MKSSGDTPLMVSWDFLAGKPCGRRTPAAVRSQAGDRQALVVEYQRLAQALGQAPDAALLEPVLARLEALRTD